MTTNTASGAADLRTAAQAVVDRWDTPLWKDVPATAEYIGRLRAALAAGQATAAQQGVGITAGMEPAATVRTLGVVGVKFSGWTDYGCSLPDGTKLYTEAQVQAHITAAPQPAPQADSVQEDAARYRAFRDCSVDDRNRLEHYSGPALDVAVDTFNAARKQGEKQ